MGHFFRMVCESCELVIEVSKGLFKHISEGIKFILSNFFVGVVFIKGSLTGIDTVLD